MSILNQVMGAAGAASSGDVTYVEDVFATSLYKGNGSSNTITSNIDLAGKGGLLWVKNRTAAISNVLSDTIRGTTAQLVSNTTAAQNNYGSGLSFLTNGFSLSTSDSSFNTNNSQYVAWTFRKQPKFFDVVTWTGNGTTNRQIAHSLGSTPGCIITKRLNAVSNWSVWHRSSGAGFFAAALNLTSDFSSSGYGNTTAFTDTYFTVSNQAETNASGGTYVAYLFAHDAGGFGPLGTDNVISCGSFTTDGGGAAGHISLGYEPQWILFKRSDGVGGWQIVDTMRGSSLTSYKYISPSASSAESSSTSTQGIYPTATGFYVGNNFPAASATYVYMTIRRGPMKVPTLGTSVFNALTRTGTGTEVTVPTIINSDMVISTERPRNVASNVFAIQDKLRGAGYSLFPNNSSSETNETAYGIKSFGNTSITLTSDNAGGAFNFSGTSCVEWLFSRAPGFFDEVCSTGFVDGTLITHNLGVTPELIIVKDRGGASNWMGAVNDAGNVRNLSVNTTSGGILPGYVYSSYFNATTINPAGILNGGGGQTKGAGVNTVIYLFATCPGISKVGSYTGNGSSQTIACGFSSGARFVMIKRTDSAGDWYIWDTARGIVAGNDPHMSLNSVAAEITTNDTIDPASSGFIVNQVAATNVNVSAATYIFLAIA